MLRLSFVFVLALPGCYLSHPPGSSDFDAGRPRDGGPGFDARRPDSPFTTFETGPLPDGFLPRDTPFDPCASIDCPPPPVACATSFCDLGTCFLEPIFGACPADQHCDFVLGCTGGLDAGFPRDAPITPRDAPIIPRDAPIVPRDTPIIPRDTPVTPLDAPILPPDAPPFDAGTSSTSRAFMCSPTSVITINDRLFLGARAEMTFELWVRARGAGTISGKGVGQRHTMLDLVPSADGTMELVAGWTDGATNSLVRTPFAAHMNRWTHLALVHRPAPSGVALELWVDAMLVASMVFPDTTSGSINRQPLEICSFDGDIDEVRMWSTARTGDLIAMSRFGMVATDAPGLVAYWPLENRAQFQSDRSLHGNDGFLGDTTVPDPRDPVFIIDGAF